MSNYLSLYLYNMKNINKVNKYIDNNIVNLIDNWEIWFYNKLTWEIIEWPVIKTTKYKYKLSNKKEFMKKWTDRDLNVAIKKQLTLLEKELLFDILDYIDSNNAINFKSLANDYWYTPSKMSKVKSWLSAKLLIKKKRGEYFLNPLIWIKTNEIKQDLIHLFQDSFDKYWVEINYN